MSFLARMIGAQARVARRRLTPTGDPLYSSVLLHLMGDSLTDYSPLAHTVSSNGDAHVEAVGKFADTSSFRFDGSGDYLSAPGGDFNLSTAPFNIRVWVRPMSTANNFAGIVASGQGSWTAGCVNLLQFGTGGGVASHQQGRIAFAGNLSGLEILSTPVTTGTWYFVEVDRDSSGDVKMWVNGTFCGSSAYHGPIDLGYNGLQIGRNGWDGSNSFYDGNIQDLMITGAHRDTGSVPTALLPIS